MSLKSWLKIPPGSHFSLANIPFGIISSASSKTPRVAVAVGDYALDLKAFAASNGFANLSTIQPHQAVFSEPTLNPFAALGRHMHAAVRKYIQSVLMESTPFPDVLQSNTGLQTEILLPLKSVKMHLPMQIGDYTDFYVGYNHAFRVGQLFRGTDHALQPNYKYLPVGYHGRASSVVVSGTPIRRPHGQILENPAAETKIPICAPTRKLDFELELGAFLCKANKMGEPVNIADAEQSIFGFVLLNDWSARDVQAWEYVPLGPFTSKNFGTSISPWVVLADALEPFMRPGIENDVELPPYLRESNKNNTPNIKLSVSLKSERDTKPTTVCETNASNLLYSFPQMLAHHTITGCPMNVGDLLGSGTISGTDAPSRACLLERTDNGKTPVALEDGGSGEERLFLHDGDQVTLSGVCGADAGDDTVLVGFGECSGTVLPAVSSVPY